ncbi:MAG: DNA-directed RNA polymerase subunit omega [Bacteroidales bacterium]|nr:DNA-directed RNA polymerase subunit omega [Bacteroidales bacterium]MDD3200869.1 DNA-directed RNA polymerase subunit omega [Bacteroidales bacterium]
MENSKQQVVTNTITRELKDIAAPTGNVYESTMIIAKRANQIAAEIKQELSHKLEEFSNYADTLEETFENREQIEISRYYERLPKPTLTAIKEFEEGKIYYRKAEE